MTEPRTIVVFNHRHLGDLLNSFPALLALRKRWPNAKIINIAAPLPLSLLNGSDLSDLNIVHPKNLRGTLAAFFAIRREKPDLALCLSGSRRVAMMARFCGAPTRAGFFPNKHEWAYNVEVPRVGPPALHHDLKMAQILGAPAIQTNTVGLLVPTQNEREKARKWLQDQSFESQKPLVGINMGASVERRQWGVENFARVAQNLADEGAQIVVFGGPQDLKSVETLKKHVQNPILSAVGAFSPRESAALMELCAALITGDTGPMHLAIAVNTPVVALFGLVPAAYRLPAGFGHIGLEHNGECQTLPKVRCRYQNSCACLNAITSDEVVNATHEQLLHHPDSQQKQESAKFWNSETP